MGGETKHAEFTAFVQATGPRLYRTAIMLTREPHQAEDLLQTTYEKLYVSWARVQRAGNPVGYARTTLTHAFLSQRRLKRSGELPTGDLPDSGTEVAYSDAVDLTAALATLPPTDRLILVLRHVEGLTVAETARETGLSEITVRTRASRAAARLRPLLSETQETR